MALWWPTVCTLQLNLSKLCTDGRLKAGTNYTGTSCIRYVKRVPSWTSPPERANPLTASPSGAAETAAAGDSAYDQFVRTVMAMLGADGGGGLPLHAYTTKSSRYPAVVPLQVESYKVTDTAGNPIKLLSVVETDASTAEAPLGASSKSGGKGKGKPSAAASKRRGKEAEMIERSKDAHTAAHEDDAVNELGAKWVVFHGADTLPIGSEVQVTVSFTGTIQQSDQGGIYAGLGTGCEDGDALLTHFEVALARFAFPCPDHPQFRLDWQLKMLQLPQSYTQIVTNGTEESRKVLAAQSAVQYSFSPCGPMPAYVFAFACFRAASDVGSRGGKPVDANGEAEGPLVSCASFVCIPPASTYRDGQAPLPDNGEEAAVPVRVLARRQSGIPLSVLEQTLKTAQEAIRRLQDFFHCPLPLLQCEHVDILLAPTMPYISGMEHHGCIFLNETIFAPKGKKGSGNAGLEEQTALVVHELAHHWVGNALGLPFSVKEGVCQLLEQCLGDVIGGRPMRKYHTGDTDTTTAAQPQETVQGKEFTGHTYQHALIALQRLVASAGFAQFESQCRELAKTHLCEPMCAVEESGGLETLRLSSAPEEWPQPPYLSTADAMSVLQGRSV